MSNIIQTHPQKLFVMVCRLNASQALVLCIYYLQAVFLMSLCCFLFNCYAFALLQSVYNLDLIADVRLWLWQRLHSSCVQSTPHHKPTVAYNL